MAFSFRYLAIIGVVLQGIAAAQAPGPVASQLSLQNLNALPRPAVPADPLDPVTGGAQPVQNAEQRAAVVTLLQKSRDLSNVRAQPYDLKTTFVSNGGLPSDGSWTLEDTAPGPGLYRWTAQGPNYAAVNLFNNTTQGMLYSNQPGGVLPLRLLQVREAIFFNFSQFGPQVPFRTAAGYVNGAAQNRVLIGQAQGQTSQSGGGRGWGDSEYCVDASTGLLTTYSPAPGLYIHYDYSNGIKFHNKTIPGSFTISEAGRTVITAKTESVSDPGDPKSALFDPAGMTPLGVGTAMTGPLNLRMMAPLDFKSLRSATNLAVQMVVLHGNLSPDGHFSETELLASSDASFNQKALDQANQFGKTMGSVTKAQPGATPQSHEMIFTFEFVTAQ